jgi:hypothetical protein
MHYDLKQYEARQRFLWLFFFLVCLLLAIPFKALYLGDITTDSVLPVTSPALKSMDFWYQQQWVHQGALAGVLIYSIWIIVLFWAGRFCWLMLQYLGRFALARALRNMERGLKQHRVRSHLVKPASPPAQYKIPESLLRFTDSLRNNPLRFVFHAYQRALFTLSPPHGLLTVEDLLDRQQRLADIDWQVFNGSWVPFRWVLRLLPALAVAQTLWLLYMQIQPVLGGQKDFPEIVNALLPALLPFLQVACLALILALGYAFTNRIENLYLAGLDTLFYDRLFSSVPIRSSDTLLMLDSMHQQFQELKETVTRLERSLTDKP